MSVYALLLILTVQIYYYFLNKTNESGYLTQKT
uniref:Uncharacterized protein n=1 Tax=Siphoviridae sp. ctYWp4 TaxID=2826377 RepID=A0A8S5N2G7_9CAUD|nr:MAG TPA: hypothetical protein [Siphoviridae sp. ctYWp4]